MLHIQIEQNDVLVFGAYDNFDEIYTWVDLEDGEEFLDQLVEQGSIRRYEY